MRHASATDVSRMKRLEAAEITLATVSFFATPGLLTLSKRIANGYLTDETVERRCSNAYNGSDFGFWVCTRVAHALQTDSKRMFSRKSAMQTDQTDSIFAF